MALWQIIACVRGHKITKNMSDTLVYFQNNVNLCHIFHYENRTLRVLSLQNEVVQFTSSYAVPNVLMNDLNETDYVTQNIAFALSLTE